MNFKRPESVLVLVHTADGEVLLLRRADREDFWQSVTGSLEPGEAPIEAARRELAEETGLDGSGIVDCHRRRRFPIAPEWRDRYAPEVTHNLEHEFRLGVGVRCRPRLDPAEHDRHVWLDIPDAAERATSWANRAAIRSLDSDPAQTTVVLVHGLWIGPHSMRLLARRLRAAGFGVAIFGWHTTKESPAAAAERLGAEVDRLDGRVVHFVGHSLGGFVLAQLLGAYRPARAGRAVLLGSPLQGATAADHLEHRGLGQTLGAAGKPLTEGADHWPRDIPVARIAGVRACGPGRLLGRLPGPNDGTVALEDIRGPGGPVRLARTTHLGLLLSRRVARMTAVYLRDGVLPSHREGTA
ncbi:dihydroneopterin triphosphate diphosphatase [Halofilum ochraceum]|uniref:dihydroneopterin triphosphate diphosphatase n=1 Tax=Halofilum ochraceum TaxID=1611323 RepID=UPI0008DA4CD2|nr:dihydroneopterin triphosphate diphosphatase [Halofilum ochraceum]